MAVKIDEAIEHIKEHGYYIMKDAFSGELCDTILEEISRLEATNVPLSLRNPIHGFKTQRFYDLLNYGDVWQRVATHEHLLPVIKRVLGDDCLLNTFGTSIIGPGEKAQVIHVDDNPFTNKSRALRNRPRLYEGGRRDSIVLNTMIALCDFTEEIGATRIIPDSNKLPYPGHGNEEYEKWVKASIPAVMPKGSILFFEGQCFHGGGANVTADQRRFAVTVDYCAGYLRSQENFMLSIPEERAAKFPAELQQLIGYRISNGGLGHIYNHNPQGLMKNVAMTGNNVHKTAGNTTPSKL